MEKFSHEKLSGQLRDLRVQWFTLGSVALQFLSEMNHTASFETKWFSYVPLRRQNRVTTFVSEKLRNTADVLNLTRMCEMKKHWHRKPPVSNSQKKSYQMHKSFSVAVSRLP